MREKEIIAVFDDDRKMVSALGRFREKNIPVKDALTPFPVHDVLKMLGRESRLPYFSVIVGISTIFLVFSFLYYAAVIDYPLEYGGKPIFTFPSFVIIMFLATILFTFIGTTLAYQVRTGLYPGKEPEGLFPGSTDDKFIIILGPEGEFSEETKALVTEILRENGVIEITGR
jgi:hypothetical protein